MTKAAKILLVEDDSAIVITLRQVLADEGYEVTVETNGATALATAQAGNFDVVVTDLKLPGMNGLELVRTLHATRPRLPILMITAHGTTETVIEAMQSGAYDYLVKPFEMPELLSLLARAVAASRLMSDPVQLGNSGAAGSAIIGDSRSMQSIYKEIGRIADKPVTVLIQGETGTGKELIARAIYQHSDRANAPFVAINCAAIPETLLESELFGHERGAFTGADSRRIGRFEQADHGTIFLDEIGDMSLGTQVKLMRVLQEKSVQRLGGKETIPVNARVIAATHRNLQAAIRQNLFREDLYYRISVVVLNLPALRERKEDIPELVRFFLRKYGPEFGVENPAIHPDAIEFLQTQDWPGNVRELENIIRKVLLLAQEYTISAEHVQGAFAKYVPPPLNDSQPLEKIVDELIIAAQRGEMTDAYSRLQGLSERLLFSRAIQKAQGNQARAARWLGVSRITMREKLIQYGLHPSQEQIP
jgi:nitrogen regulation protein NR(I)